MSPVDATLAALADPTRRQVIEMLRAGPRPAGELASRTAVSAPSMSRHLKVLKKTGLVEAERDDEADARLRIYRLRREPFVELSSWLAEIESFWGDQLAAFKAHAESGARKTRS